MNNQKKIELSADDLDKVTGGDFSFQLFGVQVDYKEKITGGDRVGGPVRGIHSTITITY